MPEGYQTLGLVVTTVITLTVFAGDNVLLLKICLLGLAKNTDRIGGRTFLPFCNSRGSFTKHSLFDFDSLASQSESNTRGAASILDFICRWSARYQSDACHYFSMRGSTIFRRWLLNRIRFCWMVIFLV